MAFWEKVGGNISNTGKSVAAKAKEMATVSNLHGQIATQEEILNRAYLDIGKRYYEMNSETPDEEYLELFTKIKEANQKIEELNQEILQAKGIQYCPNCNAEISLEAAFCVNCGTKVGAEKTE